MHVLRTANLEFQALLLWFIMSPEPLNRYHIFIMYSVHCFLCNSGAVPTTATGHLLLVSLTSNNFTETLPWINPMLDKLAGMELFCIKVCSVEEFIKHWISIISIICRHYFKVWPLISPKGGHCTSLLPLEACDRIRPAVLCGKYYQITRIWFDYLL